MHCAPNCNAEALSPPTWFDFYFHLHKLLSRRTRFPIHPRCNQLPDENTRQLNLKTWITWLSGFEELQNGKTSAKSESTSNQKKRNNKNSFADGLLDRISLKIRIKCCSTCFPWFWCFTWATWVFQWICLSFQRLGNDLPFSHPNHHTLGWAHLSRRQMLPWSNS